MLSRVVAACSSGRKPDIVFLLNQVLYYIRDDGAVISIIEKDHLYQFISVLRYRLDLHHCWSADLSAYLPISMSHFLTDAAKATDTTRVEGKTDAQEATTRSS